MFLGSTEAGLMGNITLASNMCDDVFLDTQWRAKRATCVPRQFSWHILRAGVKLV